MPPLLRAILAQALAFAVLLVLPQVPGLAGRIGGWGWVGVDAGMATIFSVALRLPWWWLPIQAAAPFAFALATGASLPAWAWALGAGLLALVYGGGACIRVPLYLSSDAACAELARLLPERPDVRAIDLGCGLAGPALALARARPDARIHGVEASPATFFLAWLRARRQANCIIRLGSIWDAPLADHDLVYAFLSPEPMPRLWEKARAEMPAGSLLVSNSFAVPGVEPERVIPLPGRADAALYCYRMPGLG